MKKRIITILSLALTVLLTLGACSSVEKNTDNANDKAVLDKNNAAAVNKPENENIPTDNHIPDVSEKKPEENTVGSTDKKSDSAENNEQKNLPTEKESNNAVSEEPITGGAVTSTSYAYISADELQTKADLILVCEYTGKSAEMIPDSEFINGAFMYKEVYTDYIFKPLNVIKGKDAEEITIRCPGGTVNGQLYVDRSTPKFETGKKYLIYLRERDKMSADDKTSYCIITTSCFEVDDSGKLAFRGGKQEDKTKIQAQCDTALAKIKPETEKAVQNNAAE